jgi:hypothetical protein
MNPFTIEWSAPEFEYHPKGVAWYWTTIIISVLLIAIAMWQKNFLFGFFIVIAEIMILIWANREPQDHNFKITEHGITIEGRTFFPVREIASFASFEDWSEDWSTIIIDLKGHFRPSVRIHVPRPRFSEIERGFRATIPLVHKEESLIDILEKFLGF